MYRNQLFCLSPSHDWYFLVTDYDAHSSLYFVEMKRRSVLLDDFLIKFAVSVANEALILYLSK